MKRSGCVTFEDLANIVKDVVDTFPTEIILGDDGRLVYPPPDESIVKAVHEREHEAQAMSEGGNLALEDLDLVAR